MPAGSMFTNDILDVMYIIFYIESKLSFMEAKMSFREKIAWVALAGIVIAATFYFGMLLRYPQTGSRAYFIGLFLATTLVQTAVTIVASVVVALFSPKDAGAPRDERDRRIASDAAALSYYPLLIGVMAAAVSIHFGNGLFGLLNTLLGVIMAAEALRFGMQIIAYRRGA
jgi:hypothetical protein